MSIGIEPCNDQCCVSCGASCNEVHVQRSLHCGRAAPFVSSRICGRGINVILSISVPCVAHFPFYEFESINRLFLLIKPSAKALHQLSIPTCQCCLQSVLDKIRGRRLLEANH